MSGDWGFGLCQLYSKYDNISFKLKTPFLSPRILFGCASFILGCSYCWSLLSGSPLLCFSFTMASLVCGSLYHALLRFPVPSSSRLLPSPFLRVWGPLLTSYFPSFFLFFPALSSGALSISALAHSRLSVLLLLPLSLSEFLFSWRIFILQVSRYSC